MFERKGLKTRILSAVISVALLIAMVWSFSFFAIADIPQATLVYDNASGKLLELGEDGSYAESADYTAAFVGTGAQTEDEGYLTAKALGFSDKTSYLEIAPKNGKTIASASGVTVTFWMKKTATGAQWEPFLSAKSASSAPIGTINVDGGCYASDGTDTTRYIIRPTKMYGNGTATVFKNATDWCKFTAVISPTGTKIYHNSTWWYDVSGTSNMEKSGSTTLSPVPTVGDLAATLYNNLAATDGSLQLRGGLYSAQATTTIRFDGLKIYPEALTDAQVSALYEADLDSLITVTLNKNNGEDAAELVIPAGTVPTLPEVLYTGHAFLGWFTDEALTVPYENTALESDTTLYAGWEQTDYSITYHLNGGTLQDPVTSYSPSAVTVLPTPVRENYVFTGWYRTEDLRGSITMTYLNQLGDLEVYAGWEAITYEVAYELDGGINHTDNPAEISVESGTVVLKPAAKKGYVFDGWYNGEEQVTEIAANGEAITLTAHWKLRVGDANKDSNITVYDAVHLLRVIGKLDTLKTDADCDYDGDGVLGTGDVILLLQYIDGNGVTLE